MKRTALLAATAAIFFTVGASAGTKVLPEPDLVAETCSQCHGDRGIGPSPLFPNLAAQDKDYLVTQLKAFRDRTRGDPHAQAYMWGMAGELTDSTINDIAAYFASLPAPQGSSSEDPAEIAAGKSVFLNGAETNGVPACNACHGETAAGSAAIPRLAGQHREYLAAQLLAFRTKQRNNEVMSANVEHMTDQQIRQISAYLSSLTTANENAQTAKAEQ